jgi:hypothetical protein
MSNIEKVGGCRKRRKLNESQKWSMVAYANHFRDPATKKFAYGCMDKVLSKFDVSKTTLVNILEEYDAKFDIDPLAIDLEPHFHGLQTQLTDEVRIAIIDVHHLAIIEGFELSDDGFAKLFRENTDFNFSKSTLQKYMDEIGLKVKSLYIKPLLTIGHKLARLNFIFSKIAHAGHGTYRFRDQKYEIHIDEKWFYVILMKKKYRLLPEDSVPLPQTIHHKAHIPKVMFLSAIGKPCDVELEDGSVVHFDGKIGIWKFGEFGPAIRNSKNRDAGTPVWKDISVTADSYREMIIKDTGLLEAIKVKLPWAKDTEIIVRHDGAKPHTGWGNEAFFNQQGTLDGWNIKFERQPAQSPDMNWNDLCFFASLQKNAHNLKGYKKDIPSLIKAVEQAYEEYDEDILVRVHALQLQIYREILKCGGGNHYEIPHSGIRNRQNHGEEAADYNLTYDLYTEARATAVGLANIAEQLVL